MAGNVLGPCSQGAQYYFRTVNGRQQKVICPKYRWQQRQEQHLQTQQYLTEREGYVEKRKRGKAVTALVKMAPALGVVGGIALGSQALKLGTRAKYRTYKKLYHEYRVGKEMVLHPKTKVMLGKGLFWSKMKPLGRFNAARMALKAISKL